MPKKFLIGYNKLDAELASTQRIPEKKRRFFVNYKLTDDGEGEPLDEEEVIVQDIGKPLLTR